MKIKLIIKNYLENDLYYNEYDRDSKELVQKRRIKQYDEDKWKNDSVYEFDTLKEMKDFIDSCDIDFTDEYADLKFDRWSWEKIDIDYYIGDKEDNLMFLSIGSHSEW